MMVFLMDKRLNTHVNTRKIAVVIPTYNEAKNIDILISKLMEVHPSLSIIIVDDNSPDGTAGIVKRLQNIYKNLYLVVRDKKRGLGGAYIEGFKYSLRKGYDVIIQMDADLSHLPSYIPEMLNLLREYDLVIGSRYTKKGGVLNWSLSRILLSRAANGFAKILLCLPINDSTSGFKAVRKTVLENIDFITITSRGYAFQIEMVFRAFLKNFKIIEYPIIFQGRRNEKSKMSLGVIVEAFLKVILLCFTKTGDKIDEPVHPRLARRAGH